MIIPLAKAQSTRRDNITNSAFLSVSARKRKMKNINNVDKVCCPLSVDLKKSAFRHFYKIVNHAEHKSNEQDDDRKACYCQS